MAQFGPGQFGTINKSWSNNPTPGILRALMMGQQSRGMKSSRETEELKRKELEQKMMLQAWLMKQAGITPGQGGPMPQTTVGPPGVAGQPGAPPVPMMAPQKGGGVPGAAPGAPADPRMNPYMSMLLGVTPYGPEQKWLAGLPEGRRTEVLETKAGMRPKAGESQRLAQDLMKWTFDFNESMKKDDRKAANKALENIQEVAVKLQEFGSPFAGTAQQLLDQYSAQYKRITGVAPKISLGVPPRGTKQAMTMAEKEKFEAFKTKLTRRGDVIRTMLTLWTKTPPGSESEKALTEGLAATLGMKVEEVKTSNPFKWALEAVGFWNPDLAFKLKGPSGGAPSPPGSPGQASPAGPPEGPITPTSRIKGETVQDWYNRLVDTQNLKPEEALSVLSAGGVKLESKRGGPPGAAEAGPPVGPPVGQMPPPPPGPMGPPAPPMGPTGPPPPPPGPAPGAETHPLQQLFQWIMSQQGSRNMQADEQAMMKMLTPGPEYVEGVRRRASGRGL